LRTAIGETEFEPQQILGYAPIEPDGSFTLEVPADVPLGLAVIDSEGRAFQTHSNWIQVRPGERRTCDGCHSPRRGASLNSGTVVNTMPAALSPALRAARNNGETMADTRARLNPALLSYVSDMLFTDAWAADPAQARAPISLRYADLATPAPTNGLINYPEHIQPIWARDRGANTCTTCHTASSGLNLSATTAGTGRLASYEELMLGDPVIDATTGLPVVVIRDGQPEIERGPALVDAMASEGDAMGLARKSRLMEILSGQTLKSDAASRTAHPTPTTVNHATILSAAEKRLVAEWMDLGGQYYNNPYASGSTVRSVTGLSEASFTATIQPILQSTCAASCHQAVGSTAVPAATSFRNNRYVLTGSAEGDYNVTLSMISDACNPASNYLLSRPSAAPGPGNTHPLVGGAAVLPVGSANYTTIANWINTGCSR
jgi:hypothetical protein